jgi:hypothetical protein
MSCNPTSLLTIVRNRLTHLLSFIWKKIWKLTFKGLARLGAVVHACNPSYSGGRDLEDLGQKKLLRSHLHKKLDMVVHTCHPIYARGIGRSITVQGTLDKASETLPEK